MATARREFGPARRAREESRAAWSFRIAEDLGADLRFAARTLRRSPAFALTAIIALALGIGANATVFNALYTVLWKPLPVRDPSTLFAVHAPHSGDFPLSFIRQLASSGVFAAVAGLNDDGLSFSDGGRAERIVGEAVTPNYFDFLGVRPIIGQPFTSDVRNGHWAAETVLSYSFWQRRYNGDPRVIGRTIRLNTYPFTIVGVSPPAFTGIGRGYDFELRVPVLPEGRKLAQMNLIGGEDNSIGTIARLRPGWSLRETRAAAQAQFEEFCRTTNIPWFHQQAGDRIRLAAIGRGDSGVLEDFHAPLAVLFVLVGLVLVVACATVANMLLARATARAREFAVRSSIGAGRSRLIRQMLAESLLLAVLAATIAVAVSQWSGAVLVRFFPQTHLDMSLDLQPDQVVLAFTVLLSLAAGLLFGLVPALQATRGDLAGALKTDSAASIGGGGASMRKALVLAQVALSLVLLIAAGVFARTMGLLGAVNYPHPKRVLLFTMKPQLEIYTGAQKRALVAEIVRRVSQLPGVEAAGVAENGPLSVRGDQGSLEASRAHSVRADIDWITPGFLDTVGIRRVSGRDFNSAEERNSRPVTIVNQALARALFDRANPIGRTIRFSDDAKAPPFEIVGMVGDTRYYDIHAAPRPAAWFPFRDDLPYMPTLHVRIDHADSGATVAAVLREFDAIDRGFPVFNIKTLAGRIDDALARERMVASLAAAIGTIALVLAAAGLYGILAWSVTRRTREIGIRMALGSGTALVLWTVIREAFWLVLAGSVVGIAISVGAYGLLAHEFPGISPITMDVLCACAGIMLAIAAAAVSVPALRACRIDPLTALRHE